MTQATNQSKLFEVMGLGPLWTERQPEVVQAASLESSNPQANTPELVPRAPADVEAIMADQPAAHAPSLNELKAQVAACTRCGLCSTRKQTVFSAGVEGSPLMVVGEAPGADEDAQGEPFVGRAGQLLDKMLASVGLNRQNNVYIGNVLKCRPPGNRNPEAAEIAACSPYLMQQIALNKPKVLLLVGAFSIRTLLNTQEAVGKLRGRVHSVQVDGVSIPAVASYHPAYLLRNPIEKRKSWQDLLLLRQVLDQQA